MQISTLYRGDSVRHSTSQDMSTSHILIFDNVLVQKYIPHVCVEHCCLNSLRTVTTVRLLILVS